MNYALRFRYFFVGRHEDTVDENNEHHQQTEERGLRLRYTASNTVKLL